MPNAVLSSGLDPAEQNKNNVEIYRQKYENFRHFDRLRWQMPGIALAIGAGVVAVSARPSVPLPLIMLVLLLMGSGTCVCAYSMRRIRARLEENRKALIEVAHLIGDDRIATPGTKSGTRSLERFLWCVAGCSFGVALILVLHWLGMETPWL